MFGQLCEWFGAVPLFGAGVEEPGVEFGVLEVVCAEASEMPPPTRAPTNTALATATRGFTLMKLLSSASPH
jgi:hypothetical protein